MYKAAHRSLIVHFVTTVAVLSQLCLGDVARAQQPVPTSSDTTLTAGVAIAPPSDLDARTKQGLEDLDAVRKTRALSDTVPAIVPKIDSQNPNSLPKEEAVEGPMMPPFEAVPCADKSTCEIDALPRNDPPLTQVVITETDTLPTPITALIAVDRRAVNGKALKATLSLPASNDAAGLIVQVTLPKELEYEEKSAAKADYDPAARTLTWREVTASTKEIIAVDGFAMMVKAEDAPVLLTLVTTISGGEFKEPLKFDTPVSVGVAQAGMAQVKEGDAGVKQWQASKRATLEFARDEAAAAMTLTTIEYPDVKLDRKTGRGLSMEFGPAQTFKQPVTLTVDVSELLPPDLLSAGFEPQLIYWPDTPDKDGITRAQRVPSVYDPSRQVLVAQITHFSVYEAVPGLMATTAPKTWKNDANLGSVGLFRGSANYAFAIPASPIPGGLQPNLSIAYSSAAADGGGKDDHNFGVGWSLDVPQISRHVKFLRHDDYYPSTGAYATWYQVIVVDNEFMLSLNGAETNLLPAEGVTAGQPGEYVPERYAPIRVFKCAPYQTCNGQAAIPWAGWEYWQVWTGDGTRWVFGGTGDGTRYFSARGGNGNAIQNWYLKRVYGLGRDDPNASPERWSANYTYQEYLKSGCGMNSIGQTDCNQGYDYDARIRLYAVDYGNSRGANWPQYQINFGNTNWYDDNGQMYAVWLNRKNGGTLVTSQYYTFGYHPGNTVPGSWGGQLSSIQQWGTKDSGASWQSLPYTSFTYDANATGDDRTKHLRTVNNGYGGQVTFNYWTGSGYHVVNGLQQTDAATGWGSFKSYSYSGGCFNNAGWSCRTTRDLGPTGALIGYSQVDEEQRNTGSIDFNAAKLQVIRHNFSADNRWIGRETDTRTMDGSYTTLQYVHTDYDTQDGTAGLPAGTWFVAPWKVTTYPLGDVAPNGALWSQTETSYGNVSASPLARVPTAQYLRSSDGSSQRSDHTGYAVNIGKWIIKPGYQNSYDGITGDVGCGSAFRTQIMLFYDSHAEWNVAPDRGLVTRVLRGNVCAGLPVVNQFFGYDGSPAGSYVISGAGNVARVQDARGYESYGSYDSMGLFLTSLTNALNQTTYFYYHGVNPAGDQDGQTGTGLFGQLQATQDPNGARTFYGYDQFGRLRKLAKPGDGYIWPTQEYFYLDKNGASDVSSGGFAPPLMVQTFQRKTARTGSAAYGYDSGWWACGTCGSDSNALAFWTRDYYDGFGRAIQAQKPAADWPSVGNRNVSFTWYDAFGRATWTSVPYDVADSAPYWSSPDWNRAKTTTSYDAANRVVSVTGPDGATSTKNYYYWSGWQVTDNKDARNHIRQAVVNALGQLRKVRELSGDNGAEGGYALYGETTYAYDYAGNLINVTDAAGNLTTLTYDALGRKTAMSDPDMGSWSYGYDGNGNLNSQTDARGNVLTFAYDALDRMTDKYVNGAWTSWNRYDEGGAAANALGRRTRMGLAVNLGSNWSNETYFYYDTRGRMTQEHRYIDGGGWFNTNYAYDQADRVTQMTYPTGERVVTTFTPAGNPATLRSLDWYTNGGSTYYITGASYNALGQPRDMSLGNGQQTRYRYWALDFTFVPRNNNNYAYGRLRQICVTGQGAGACAETGGTSQPLNMSYDYDVAGNLTVIADWPRNEYPVFSYDHLDRLTGVTGPYAESYTYNVIGNITYKTNVGSYDYYNWGGCTGYRPHAVRYTSAGHGYCYDGNGNAYWRYENGHLYLQSWDADNRLTGVQEKSTNDWSTNIGAATTFSYDADGNRVKRVGPSGTTFYIGDHSELIPGVKWTQYYTFNGQRVAVRDGWNVPVSWLQGDHLGSASMTTDAAGAKTSEYRYTPFGGVRVAWGNLPTNRKFTGYAREDAIGGIDFAQARYYDSVIGRFLSPDTIVPNPADPQSLNRFSYVRNSPLNYTDPTGHDYCIGYPMYACAYSAPSAYSSPEGGAGGGGSAVGTGIAIALGAAGTTAADVLSTPLDVAPAASSNTAGTLPNVQQPLVLADPNNAVAGAGGVESYPTGQEAGGLQLTTPLEGTSTVALTTRVSKDPGVYEFPDKLNPGKTYIGQSSNMASRLAQHKQSGRWSGTDSDLTTTAVTGGKLAREIFEQNRITSFGGIGGGNVSNIRNPIGPNRYQQSLDKGLKPYRIKPI